MLAHTDSTTLVIVRVDPQGRPGEVGYWRKKEGAPPPARAPYRPGVLLDLLI